MFRIRHEKSGIEAARTARRRDGAGDEIERSKLGTDALAKKRASAGRV
jgi:hypothetical protein